MKKYLIFFILIYLFATQSVQAEVINTSGFIPWQIWYSKEPLVEGDTVKIFTAVWNNGISPLSAKIEFYDKNVLLGVRDIVIPASKLNEVSVLWKVTSGDHLISAKIISPSITIGGKKEIVSLDRNIATGDKRFVPILIRTIDGTPVLSSDIINNQIDRANNLLENILPSSISTPISDNLSRIETFRSDTLKSIIDGKIEAQKKIDLLSKASSGLDENGKKIAGKVLGESTQAKVDATEKPIAYIKLFFLSALSFIFGSKTVFYLVGILLVFVIVRFVYRKIRNR